MVLRLTKRENLDVSVREITASTILRMSEAVSLFFFPTLMDSLDASTINTSVEGRCLFRTITSVAIGVPKKISAGKPIIASILLLSIRFLRML